MDIAYGVGKMNAVEVTKQRRSIRDYQDRPVAKAWAYQAGGPEVAKRSRRSL